MFTTSPTLGVRLVITLGDLCFNICFFFFFEDLINTHRAKISKIDLIVSPIL